MMHDLIERQAVLEILRGDMMLVAPSKVLDAVKLYINEVERRICDMPSIQLNYNSKSGYWIDHRINNWIYAKCSNCGAVHDTKTTYCPSCGVKMFEVNNK